jgi:amidophosphoribosyltransferase
MSDSVKHECGIAQVRLLKPLEYYQAKYGTWKYGLNKLYLMMEKQHNRGQDGAGVVCVKLGTNPGEQYIHRVRSNAASPIKDVFEQINAPQVEIEKTNKELLSDAVWAKDNLAFAGEIYLGHLRYGTFGKNDINAVHPVIRDSNWKSRNLAIAGNFNMANMNELFDKLIELGQHPKGYSDLVTILEKIGHFLDRENQKLFDSLKAQGKNNAEITKLIASQIDVAKVLRGASKTWDGGYAIGGIIGSGESFLFRDPSGIRPAFYYYDDEIVITASERPVIQTVMNLKLDQVKELEPGQGIIVTNEGRVKVEQINEPKERRACSFERIYFSRGSDADIYKERKMLGKLLIPAILKTVDYDYDNTVFSYIPNTAETAYYGMMEGLEASLNETKIEKIISQKENLTPELLKSILDHRPRMEKIAHKDVKIRTFITEDKNRDDLVGHVYDVTYGVIREGKDNLVIIDDSIVRGTTLKKSIFKILDRLGPKKIVIVSSAPQIRYPDCYGIDMAKLGDLAAFSAAIELLKESGKANIINEVYNKCVEQKDRPKEEIVNYVQDIYKPFTDEQISNKIAEMLTPTNINAEIAVIYQTVENLNKACPNHLGDWYFTGNYPTPGGNRAANNSFINYIEGKNIRSY